MWAIFVCMGFHFWSSIILPYCLHKLPHQQNLPKEVACCVQTTKNQKRTAQGCSYTPRWWPRWLYTQLLKITVPDYLLWLTVPTAFTGPGPCARCCSQRLNPSKHGAHILTQNICSARLNTWYIAAIYTSRFLRTQNPFNVWTQKSSFCFLFRSSDQSLLLPNETMLNFKVKAGMEELPLSCWG